MQSIAPSARNPEISRIEELQGRRWAKEICMLFYAELTVIGGYERLIQKLQWGLVEKPEGYKIGVLEIITVVEDAKYVRAIGGGE
jgi:hypothetical protein